MYIIVRSCIFTLQFYAKLDRCYFDRIDPTFRFNIIFRFLHKRTGLHIDAGSLGAVWSGFVLFAILAFKSEQRKFSCTCVRSWYVHFKWGFELEPKRTTYFPRNSLKPWCKWGSCRGLLTIYGLHQGLFGIESLCLHVGEGLSRINVGHHRMKTCPVFCDQAVTYFTR